MSSAAFIATSLGAREHDATTMPLWNGALREVAEAAGVKTPPLFILPAEEPNACVLSFGDDDSVVILFSGLLDRLDEREVRAVLAHEVGHLKHGDAVETTRLIQRAAVRDRAMDGAATAGVILSSLTEGIVDDWLVLGGVAVSAIVRRRAQAKIGAFQRRREFGADETAVRMGLGPWLASALVKLESAVVSAPAPIPHWSRLAMLNGHHDPTATHPPLGERLAAWPPRAYESLNLRTCSTCGRPLDGGDCPSGHAGSISSCPGCGHTGSSGDRFCRRCGAAKLGEACRQCGRSITQSAVNCDGCGSQLP